jgi:hypothetical protein
VGSSQKSKFIKLNQQVVAVDRIAEGGKVGGEGEIILSWQWLAE